MLANFFSCYLWWFLAGALVGWLLNWLLCKCCGRNTSATTHSTTTTATNTATNLAGGAMTQAPDAAVAAAVTSAALDRTAARAAGFNVKGEDDLTAIEGIGPKICGLFHAAGYRTFTQVSNMTVVQMSKILDDAGPNYRLANPETWAQQAKLAATNRWTDLKALQDQLTAGVNMSSASGATAGGASGSST